MKRDEALRKRDRLAAKLPTGELLRGSLLQRTIRHKRGCPKCARGEGHPVLVLTVSYAGGKTRQISLRPEQKAMVQKWLKNYLGLKDRLERICELNHVLLRSEP
jgi:hypothetical protein